MTIQLTLSFAVNDLFRNTLHIFFRIHDIQK